MIESARTWPATRRLAVLGVLLVACSNESRSPTEPLPIPTFGALLVSTSTSGQEQDVNGYLVAVDGAAGRPIGTNGTVIIDHLEAGDRRVELTNVARNCSVGGGSRRTVTLADGSGATLALAIDCTPSNQVVPAGILFAMGEYIPGSESFEDGPWRHSPQIHLMSVNGSGPGFTSLTFQTNHSVPGSSFNPAISPDGRKIAFTSNRNYRSGADSDIYLMDYNGTGVVRLTSSSRSDYPAWSPDGTRIAFVVRGSGIWVMLADGTGAVRLTSTGGSSPKWSPDGRRIAFIEGSSVWTVNADGTGVARLTQPPPGWPGTLAWSPDGNRIAFARTEYRDGSETGGVYLMNHDGSGVVLLTEGPGFDVGDWSPDGQRILGTQRSYGLDFMEGIVLIDVKDGRVTELVTSLAGYHSPSFWPTGTFDQK